MGVLWLLVSGCVALLLSEDQRRPRQMWWTTTVVVAVVVCLQPGPLTTTHAAQLTAVCADLVGAGGVGVRVWPTIKASPQRLANKLHFRLLQINWDAEEILEGDWLGVFEQDPRPPHARPPPTTTPPSTPHRFWQMPRPLYWDTPFSSRGTITTNITQRRTELSVLARGGCVGVFVGYVRNGVCVAADCQAAHPTWLFDHRQVLGGRSLRSLVMPGTHNAGSYSLKDRGDVVSAWVVCQDEDIISQLLYGNRYLDLRVAYYPDTPELLWINHDLVRWRPLLEVLNGVRGFLAISPDPIIIDVHRTPVGFDLPEALPLLLSLMNETLGSHFLHNRYGPLVTLDQIWKIGKRVIFTFADADAADDKDWVWPPLPQAWANAQLLDDLRTYLDAQMNKRVGSPRLWAAMAHLTPTLWDMILRSHVGVRGMADKSNFAITRWLRQRWGHMANIIASDFFRGNDIINVAIRTNLALTLCRPPQPRRQLIIPVKPQRHPVSFRRSTGFRITTEPRRPGYSQTPSGLRNQTTTLPPLFRRIYSPPRRSQENRTRTLSPLAVTVRGIISYSTHSSNESNPEDSVMQPVVSTEPPLHPLIRVFTAPTDSPSLMSSNSVDQSNGNRWSELADYPPPPSDDEKADELVYVSEPMASHHDPPDLEMPPAPAGDVQDPPEAQDAPKYLGSELPRTGSRNVSDWHQYNNQSSDTVIATISEDGDWLKNNSQSPETVTNAIDEDGDWLRNNSQSPGAVVDTTDKESDWLTNSTQVLGDVVGTTVKTIVLEKVSGNDEGGKGSKDSDEFLALAGDEGVQEYTHSTQTTRDTDTTLSTTLTSDHNRQRSQTTERHPTQTQTTERHPTQTQTNERHSTQAQTTERHPTQTQTTESHLPEIQTTEHHLPQTQTTEHHSTQTQTTHRYPTQPQTIERHPTQTQTTERHPTQTQTTERHPTQTQTAERHSTQTQTNERHSTQTQTTESHLPQIQTTEHYLPQIQTTERHSTQTQTNERHSTQTQTTERYPTQTQTTERHPTQTETIERHSTQTQTTEYYPTYTQTTERHPTQTQTTHRYPTQTQTTEHHLPQTQTNERHPTQTQTTERHSTQTPTTERHSAQTQTTERHSTQTQAPERHSTQTQTTHRYLTQTQTIESHSTQTQNTERHPIQTQTTERHPTQTQTAERHPTETKNTARHRTQAQNIEHLPTQTQIPELYSKQIRIPELFSTQTQIPELNSIQTRIPELFSTQSQTPEHYTAQTPNLEHHPTQTQILEFYSTRSRGFNQSSTDSTTDISRKTQTFRVSFTSETGDRNELVSTSIPLQTAAHNVNTYGSLSSDHNPP